MTSVSPIVWFDECGLGDVARVGGKNASLGEFAGFLVEQGIDSISLNPDAVLRTMVEVAALEGQIDAAAAGSPPLPGRPSPRNLPRDAREGERDFRIAWPVVITSRSAPGRRTVRPGAGSWRAP